MIRRLFSRIFISNRRGSWGDWHIQFIVLIARILRPKVYVELGIYQGDLFNKLLPYCDKMYAVDINNYSSNYIKNSGKVEFFHGSSSSFIEVIQSNKVKIDLLFIDADHSMDAVLQDFYNYFPYVNKNGLILVHDSFPQSLEYTDEGYSGTCYKAIEIIKANLTVEYEILTIPFPPGITMIRKVGPYKWDI
jgi:predicted O-methyltransferase YrrM